MSVSDILNQTLNRVTRDNSKESPAALDFFQTPQSDRSHESYQSALKKSLDAHQKPKTSSREEHEVPDEFRTKTSQTQDSEAASSHEPASKVEQRPEENSVDSSATVDRPQHQHADNQHAPQEDPNAGVSTLHSDQEADNGQANPQQRLEETGDELPAVPASLAQQLNPQTNAQDSKLTNEFTQADPAKSEQSLPTPASLLEIQKLLEEDGTDAESADQNGSLIDQTEINSELTGNEELLTETELETNQSQEEISEAEKLAALEESGQSSNATQEKSSEIELTDTEESPTAETSPQESGLAVNASEPETELLQQGNANDDSSENDPPENQLPAPSQGQISESVNKQKQVKDEEQGTASPSPNELSGVTTAENKVEKLEQKSLENKQNESPQNNIKAPANESVQPKPDIQVDQESQVSSSGTEQEATVVNTPAPSSTKETTTVSPGLRSETLPAADSAEFMERLTELVQAADSGEQKLQVRLTPPQLGSLNIEVTKVDGVVTAKLEVQSAAAQQVLLEHLTGLKESLSQQGNVVERIEIQLQDPNRSEQGQNQSQNEQQRQQNQRDPKQQNQSFTEENSGQEETSEENNNEGTNSEGPQSTLIDNLDIQI